MNHSQPHQPAGITVREIVYREPLSLARRLKGCRHLTLFESSLRQERLGRYSFLSCNPSDSITVVQGQTFLNGEAVSETAFALLSRMLRDNHQSLAQGLPPFQGGFAGYIAYDFGARLEPKAKIGPFPQIGPELMLHRFDTGIAFDHLQERAWIMSVASPAAAEQFEALLARPAVAPGSGSITGWSSNFTRQNYEQAVARTREYILAGDIFQANISQCFSAAVPEGFDALAFYAKLRNANPATFAAFLDYGDVQIASSSPERLVSLNDRLVEARPIKGTRRRDADKAKDAALVAELVSSRKDRAENVMIVDLLRNDLSRVCEPGTVQVPVLCGLESYASVHHLTSVVQGQLRASHDAASLLAAVFPGGSITGAPKVRAMEIIAEIEQQRRGIYCGSIGYFGFNGLVDLNIAIRTAMFEGGVARVSGGGGITARSEPAAEYEETLVKVKRIMEAFEP